MHVGELWHRICGKMTDYIFCVEYKKGIVMTFRDIEVLYSHTNCVFNWKLAFSMHFDLIENCHFQLILISYGSVIWRKIPNRSTFWLQFDVFSCWDILLQMSSHEKWPPKNVHVFLCDVQEKSLKMCLMSFWNVFYVFSHLFVM